MNLYGFASVKTRFLCFPNIQVSIFTYFLMSNTQINVENIVEEKKYFLKPEALRRYTDQLIIVVIHKCLLKKLLDKQKLVENPYAKIHF